MSVSRQDEERAYAAGVTVGDLPVEGERAILAQESARAASSKRTRVLILVLVLVLVSLIAAVVGLAIGMKQRGDSSSSSPNPAGKGDVDRDGGGSSVAPTPTRTRKERIESFLLAEGISSEADLRDETSAQSQAVSFMTDDGLSISIPSSMESAGAYRFVTRYVLAVFYHATSPWVNQVFFLSGSDHCRWNDIFLDMLNFQPVRVGCFCESIGEEQVIYNLRFPSFYLTGSIPTEIAKLSTLRILTLPNNALGGGLPPLPDSMERLSLNNNLIGGTIPSSYGSANLQILVLSNNKLESTVPDTLSKLSDLQMLALDDNLLTGSVLPVVSSLPILDALFLEDNGFNDTLDNLNLTALPELIYFDISDNSFRGQIQPELFRHPKLQVIDLHGNYLSGGLPSMQPNSVLSFFAVHENNLSGEIPESIENLLALEHLDLTSTKLKGILPLALGNMTNLEYLFLTNNPFDAGKIPDLRALTKMKDLSLKKTQRTGLIPAWFVNMSYLILLDLDLNSLTGNLPPELGNSNIQFLQLQRNNLNGSIPDEWNNWPSLAFLDIENNTIAGSAELLCGGIHREDFAVIADCGANNPEIVNCSCCILCCDDSGVPCNDGDALMQYDPIWEDDYERPVTYLIYDDLNISAP